MPEPATWIRGFTFCPDPNAGVRLDEWEFEGRRYLHLVTCRDFRVHRLTLRKTTAVEIAHAILILEEPTDGYALAAGPEVSHG